MHQQVGHTGFGHERKNFLSWNDTKKESGAMEYECHAKEIQTKPLCRFQLALRKEGVEGSPLTEHTKIN